MNVLTPKEQMLLALNKHGFLWIAENDIDTAENLVMEGYCVDTEIWDKGHRMKRYEITYLGLMNANSFLGMLEYQHKQEARFEKNH